MLVATLVGWNLLLDWMAFRFAWAYRLIEPPLLLLIRRGRVLHKHLRAEMITVDELRAHLREHGIESFTEVESARLESDGQFSVIKHKGEADVPAGKRTPGR